MESRLITALDVAHSDDALSLAACLDPALTRLKVGKELFVRGGPGLVETLQRRGFEVFLDLKFHDIPNTVAGAVRAAVDLGVWMVNVHASGGRAMLEAARAAAPVDGPTRLIAVTVLTSLGDSDLAELGLQGSVKQQVARLAQLARSCQLDGAVCSAQESAMLKQRLGASFLLVTPGVRPVGSDPDDQCRIMTPAAALAAGSDYLVIGRPITGAADPLQALKSIVESLYGNV